MNRKVKDLIDVGLFALLIRLIFFGLMMNNPDRFTTTDSKVTYIPIALNLLELHEFSADTMPPYEPDAYRTPGYPLFLAFCFGVFGKSLHFAVLLQILLSVVCILLVYLLGYELFDRKTGLIAALFLAIDPGSISYSLFVLSETLFSFLLILSVYFFIKSEKARAELRSALAGLFVGLATLTRPIAQFFAAIPFLFWVLKGSKEGIKRGLLFLLFFVLTLTPWLYRNQRVFKRPFLSIISSYNLLFYNAAVLQAQLEGVKIVDIERGGEINRIREELRNEALSDIPPDASIFEKAERYRSLALRIILRHPLKYAILHLRGALTVLIGSNLKFLLSLQLGLPSRQTGVSAALLQGKIIEAFKRALKMGAIFPLVLLELVFLLVIYFLALLGFIKSWKSGANRPALLFLFLTFFYFVLVAGPVSSGRFRVPVAFIPYLFAASWIVGSTKNEKKG